MSTNLKTLKVLSISLILLVGETIALGWGVANEKNSSHG